MTQNCSIISPKMESCLPTARLDSLTGLRGILAGLVVILHWSLFSQATTSNVLLNQIIDGMGRFGVSGFFVLSGFILTYTYRQRTWTIKEFFSNRFARIYPLYLFSILFALPLDWYAPGLPSEGKFRDLFLTLGGLQSWFDFAKGRFNAPSWTISVELFFYLIFPLLFWIRKKSKPTFLVTSVLMVVLTVINWHNGGHGLPINRLAEFILGMWIVDLLKINLKTVKYPLWIAFVFLLLGLTGHHLLKFSEYEYVWMPIMVAPVCDSRRLPGLRSKGWILAGEISYSVYLIHAPVQRYFRVAYSKIFHESLTVASPLVKASYFLSTTVVTLLVAYMVWKWIELPGRIYLRRRLS